MKLHVVSLVSMAVLAAAAHAAPVTLDFEGIGPSGSGIPANQFAAQGITWLQGDLYDDFGGLPGHSGTFSAINQDYQQGRSTDIEFVSSQVLKDFSANILTASVADVVIDFYLNNVLVHTEDVTDNTYPNFIAVAVSGFDFDRVLYHDSGHDILMDDIVMNPQTSVVPLPACSALAGLGLLGLGVRRRRSSL